MLRSAIARSRLTSALRESVSGALIGGLVWHPSVSVTIELCDYDNSTELLDDDAITYLLDDAA
jgi:hypothetical protein